MFFVACLAEIIIDNRVTGWGLGPFVNWKEFF